MYSVGCVLGGRFVFMVTCNEFMEVLTADFAWVVCEVWRAWRVIGDSFAAAGCCAGHGVSAAVCVIGLQLLCLSLIHI